MANTAFKIDNGLVVSGQSADIYSPVKIFSTLNVSSSVTIGGSLTVTGNLTYSNTQISGELVPTSSGIPLGNTANRFDLYARNIYVANNVLPTANGIVLGGVSARFDGYFTNINSNGIITVGTTTLNSTFYAATANNANTVFGLGDNGIVVRTGSGSGAVRTLQSSNGMSITNANGVSGDPTMTLLIQDGLFSNTTGMYINASAIAIGNVPITRGGTGSTSQAGAANNILPAQGAPAIGQFLRSTGSAVEWADGPLGFTGSKGFTGSQGTTGSVGFTGSKGDIGNTGSTGPQGPIGFTGSASTVVGPTGPTGPVGSIGFTGSLGGVGPTGPTGGIGPAGFTGSQGNLGYIGSQGYTGSVGPVGLTGGTGPIGFTGSKGNIGNTGPIGFTGSASTVAGPGGGTGPTGPTGFTGSRGPDKLVSAGQQVFSTTSSLTSSDTGSHIIAATAGITLTLPTSAVNGSIISLSNVTAGTITLSYSGSVGTDGPTSLEAGGSLMLISDGSSPPFWRKFFFSAGTATKIQMGGLGVGTTASATTGEIRATNDITAYYSSDRNLKENIQPIENALNKVRSINGVMFDWTDEYINSRGGEDGYFVRRRDTGLIAQEVEEILPEVVGTREDGYKAVKYDRLAGLIIQAINELADEVDKLRGDM